jgi:hypothetical protein
VKGTVTAKNGDSFSGDMNNGQFDKGEFHCKRSGFISALNSLMAASSSRRGNSQHIRKVW